MPTVQPTHTKAEEITAVPGSWRFRALHDHHAYLSIMATTPTLLAPLLVYARAPSYSSIRETNRG